MGRFLLLLSFVLLLSAACRNTPRTNSASSDTASSFNATYQSNVKAIVSLRTFDYYTRPLNKGYGFYIAEDLVITNLDWVKGAYKLKAAPMDTDDFTSVSGFVAYDLDHNLLLLKVSRKNPNFPAEGSRL